MKVNGQVIKWKYLSEGTYNSVYVSREPFSFEIDGKTYHQHWVLKKPKTFKNQKGRPLPLGHIMLLVNRPERAVRIWNELHPKRPAALVEEGWIAPYLGDEQAQDASIVRAQIDIYRRTRRIIIDAYVYTNFLHHKEETVCIDTDYALRPDSPTSQKFYDSYPLPYLDKVWDKHVTRGRVPESVAVTRSLHYLENHLDRKLIKDEFIIYEVIYALHRYRILQKPINEELLQRLYDYGQTTDEFEETKTLRYLENQIPLAKLPFWLLTPLVLKSIKVLRENNEHITVNGLYRVIELVKSSQAVAAKEQLSCAQLPFFWRHVNRATYKKTRHDDVQRPAALTI